MKSKIIYFGMPFVAVTFLFALSFLTTFKINASFVSAYIMSVIGVEIMVYHFAKTAYEMIDEYDSKIKELEDTHEAEIQQRDLNHEAHIENLRTIYSGNTDKMQADYSEKLDEYKAFASEQISKHAAEQREVTNKLVPQIAVEFGRWLRLNTEARFSATGGKFFYQGREVSTDELFVVFFDAKYPKHEQAETTEVKTELIIENNEK